ncbi:hypothetical protein OG871_39885 (plasmid) [Kitasatospora sp. NBC_00374]|uniref:hypothetical protein n=1 Tax=Kitasatospora sp. NBC_00374 TaxID=2975964 RepID=UPI002F9078D4
MPEPTTRHGSPARRLLGVLAEHDQGKGLHFDQRTRDRWCLHGTGYVVRSATFRELAADQLIDVGDSNEDPVTITELGRAYHAAVLEGPR